MRITENQIRRIVRQVLSEAKRASNWDEYVPFTAENTGQDESTVQDFVNDYKAVLAKFKDDYAKYENPQNDKDRMRKIGVIELGKVMGFTKNSPPSDSYDDFVKFIKEKTNATVLRNPRAEADDLIAGWIHNHPKDNHVIISTDGDFAQLIAHNVKQYNGVSNTTITHEGYFDDKGREVIDKKTKLPREKPNPEWQLFEKCMRGDTSDNVFSAYPGVRKKGTRNKVGLLEAFADKNTKGYNWNNLMLQRWVDHNGKEHRVLDDYNRNVTLCDLTAQPNEVKEIINNTISTVETKNITQVGMRLLKFCAKWDMQRIADQAAQYAQPLQARYENDKG